MIDLQRSELVFGREAIEKLKNSHVAIFGLGGVGSFAAEAIARSGVGEITLVDKDTIDPTNINRQLLALDSTIGKLKTDLMAERIADINISAVIHRYPMFFLPETQDNIDLEGVDAVIDAIDTVSAKILLAEICTRKGIFLISSMGTGNKLDPTRFEVDDIYNTSVCPLAKVMRRELKKRGIPKLKVVYSREEPRSPLDKIMVNERKTAPGSVSFVPPVAGMILAGEVIKHIAGI
ncbi:MAG: tRNA threonylcarbamoyladenosine dehydratase [Clostridia bacterium]|nr:tRNA threonylcarbamoyladenosine dehydratase [Clostridia bacterium]